ncbi:unnamed protein product [Polarella glacialis]|uniref:Uncharacterized protein n=1 Tax=Polarella glacialis TaxID=89957 RepID=A0A813HD78_POLGL|nr:unnamed protein product [Polarella glacialis]
MDDSDASASGPALCYVRNDLPIAFQGRVLVQLIHFGTGVATMLTDAPVSLAAGAGAMGFFCALDGAMPSSSPVKCSSFASMFASEGCTSDGSDCMLEVLVTDASNNNDNNNSNNDNKNNTTNNKNNITNNNINNNNNITNKLLSRNELLLAAPSKLRLPAAKV